jgi:hypothetical protein
MKARSLCDGGSSLAAYARPLLGVQLRFCDDPQIARTLRCQNAADECSSP